MSAPTHPEGALSDGKGVAIERFPLLRDKLALWTSLASGQNEWRDYNRRASAELWQLLTMADAMVEALVECEDYFDGRADADCDQDGFVPNKEMRLLSTVRAALALSEPRQSPEVGR